MAKNNPFSPKLESFDTSNDKYASQANKKKNKRKLAPRLSKV